MSLSKTEINLFFKLHPALLQYVNKTKKLFPKIKTAKELRLLGDIECIGKVRRELWNNPKFIDDFITENPENFSKKELLIIGSWKNFISEKFFIFRHLKKYTIFLTEKYPAQAYGVHYLNTHLDDMFYYTPVYTKAVLLPFCGKIIYDAVLEPYSITFGGGFKSNLNESYREAKEKFGIIEAID